jgi:predicted hydrolase (HD superfamily)
MKKWSVTGFAKGVKREDIERGAQDIGIPLKDHVRIVLQAMQKIAPELGL